jgi:hypothetical protein
VQTGGIRPFVVLFSAICRRYLLDGRWLPYSYFFSCDLLVSFPDGCFYVVLISSSKEIQYNKYVNLLLKLNTLSSFLLNSVGCWINESMTSRDIKAGFGIYNSGFDTGRINESVEKYS